MTKLITITLLPLLMGIMAGCSKEKIAKNDYNPIQLDTKSLQLITAGNEFGFELFKILSEENEDLFISPLSISQAFGMCYNGATNETADEIKSVLGFADLSKTEVNKSLYSIRKSLLNADNSVTLTIANSIWYSHLFNINPTFVSTNKTFFDAETKGLDFSKTDASLKAINGWVSDKTKGKIPSIIDEITPEHVMFLINAVYFKGKWQYIFEKAKTTKRPFYHADNTSNQVDMMVQETDLNYTSNQYFSAVELPYGNGHFSMVVLLPNSTETPETVIAQLNKSNWDNWISGMSKTGVQIYLPKFKLENDLKLNQPLIDMGMPRAFTTMAQFEEMGSPSNLKIDEVKHKTFVEVGEEGTEAAAVTSIGIVLTSIGSGSGPAVVFDVNRPFVFAIREKDTGAIMFLGKIKNLE